MSSVSTLNVSQQLARDPIKMTIRVRVEMKQINSAALPARSQRIN